MAGSGSEVEIAMTRPAIKSTPTDAPAGRRSPGGSLAVRPPGAAPGQARRMSSPDDSVRLVITLDVSVQDPIAAASFLLAAAQNPDGQLVLPAAPTLRRQVAQIVDEAVRDCLRSEKEATGLLIESLRVSEGPELPTR